VTGSKNAYVGPPILLFGVYSIKFMIEKELSQFMGKDSSKKWIRPKATFKATKVSNFETRPWQCPSCGARFKALKGLTTQFPLSITVSREKPLPSE